MNPQTNSFSDNKLRTLAVDARMEDLFSGRYNLEEQVDRVQLRLSLILERQFAIAHVLNLYSSSDKHLNAIITSNGRLMIDLWEELDLLSKVLYEVCRISKRRPRSQRRRRPK